MSDVLLDTVRNSGALLDPSVECVNATAAAISGVLGPAGVNSTGGIYSDAVADKAAGLILDVVNVAGLLEDGLPVDTASVLLSTVASLLLGSATQATASANATASRTSVIERLQAATSAIGDAVLNGAPAGELITVTSAGGLELNLKKVNLIDAASKGTQVGSFLLPPLGVAVTGACASGDASLRMQNTQWPVNPHTHAGNTDIRSARVRAGEHASMVDVSGSIDERAVQSMHVKQCGNILNLSNLDPPVLFNLTTPQQGVQSGSLPFRACLYYDNAQKFWSSEGVWLQSEDSGKVTCASSHLSDFTSVRGLVLEVLEAFDTALACDNSDFMYGDSLVNIVVSSAWLFRPGAAIIGFAVFVHIVLFTVSSVLTRKYSIQQLLWDDSHFLTSDAQWDTNKTRPRKATWRATVTHNAYEFLLSCVTSSYLAFHLRLHVDDIAFFEKFELSRKGTSIDDEHQDVEAPLDVMVAHIDKSSLVATVAEMQARIDTVGSTSANYMRRHLAKMQANIDTAEDKTLGELSCQLARIQKHVNGANDDISNHMFRFDNGLYSERTQSCLYNGIAGLFWINFVSSMPLFNMFLFGISVSLNGHVMLHNITVVSSLLVVALFFQGDGQGLSADSDDQCSEQFERSLFVQLAIGVLSQPIVILPYYVFQAGMQRTVQYCDQWDERAKKKALSIRNIRYRVIWFMGWTYVGVCLLFLMSFLANVSEKDHWDFIRASSARLLDDFLFFPLCTAFFATIGAVVLHRFSARGGTNQNDIHGWMLAIANGQLNSRVDELKEEEELHPRPESHRHPEQSHREDDAAPSSTGATSGSPSVDPATAAQNGAAATAVREDDRAACEVMVRTHSSRNPWSPVSQGQQSP